MKTRITWGWIVGGWIIALLASALPIMWFMADRI